MTLADVFSTDYGFDIGAGGLAYVGLGVGFIAASLFGAKFGSESYRRVSAATVVLVTIIPNISLIIFSIFQLAEKNGGVGKPEMRIPALCVGSLFVPVGLL